LVGIRAGKNDQGLLPMLKEPPVRVGLDMCPCNFAFPSPDSTSRKGTWVAVGTPALQLTTVAKVFSSITRLISGQLPSWKSFETYMMLSPDVRVPGQDLPQRDRDSPMPARRLGQPIIHLGAAWNRRGRVYPARSKPGDGALGGHRGDGKT